MSILQWDPIEELFSVRREMSRLVQEGLPSFRSGLPSRQGDRIMRLPLDAYATDEEIVITAAVPGLSPDDVEVSLEGTTLTVRGEFRAPLENVDYLFQERPFGLFRRSVTINVPIEVEQAEAKFDNGILTIILPKAAQARPKVIEVKLE